MLFDLFGEIVWYALEIAQRFTVAIHSKRFELFFFFKTVFFLAIFLHFFYFLFFDVFSFFFSLFFFF